MSEEFKMMTAAERLMALEFEMSLKDYIAKPWIIEELRLLAETMSTHKALADKIGISEAYLCDILKGRRDPGPVVCKFLKVEAITVYREV